MNRCDTLDALLPQTQCGLCGYGGCRPYAEAMATGAAGIDRCPPGGVTTLRALANVLEIESAPYEAAVAASARLPATAIIREAECIGCTKCIQSCPVDAIVGAAKFMHSIISQECTGCGLCIEPCPVDCIDWVPLSHLEAGEMAYDPALARSRAAAKRVRLLQTEQSQAQHYHEKRRLMANTDDEDADKEAKKSYILAAMARTQSVKK